MKLPSDIKHLLENTYGLDYTILGTATFENLIRNRAEHHKLTVAQDYFQILRSSPSEMQIFLEGLLVSESWFFRDRLPFSFMLSVLESKKNQFVNILSLGCAAGEEPYSICMTLLDNGWSSHEFSITAIDLSSKAIDKALIGEYTKMAFRGIDALGKDKHFETSSSGKRLVKSNIRKPITFSVGNALSPSLLENSAPFDIIFFRNTLIYFTEAARKQVFHKIKQLLKPGGTLFLGHADALGTNSKDFSLVGPPGAFAYQTTPKNQTHHKTPTTKNNHSFQK